MTFDQIWSLASKIIDAALIPILTALGVWGVAQVRRYQAKTDLKTMQDNSMAAVKAVEQLYPDLTGSEKRELALTWANHLNAVAGVSPAPTPVMPIGVTPPSTQLMLNEGNVGSLPKTPPSTPLAPVTTEPDKSVVPLG